MKKFIYTLLIVIISFFGTSCKKEPTNHEIKYEITFHQFPSYGYTNQMSLSVFPAYVGTYNYDPQNPTINYAMAKTGYWEYEYWALHDGDEVNFSLYTFGDYYYTMRIYIDGDEVSQKEIYKNGMISSSGNGVNGDYEYEISFTYHE